jgi:hypothetical protein
MSDASEHLLGERLKSPRAAAVAGIAFAILFGTAQVLIRKSIPPNASDPGTWLQDKRDTVSFALALIPFAGIAFLWFIGVLRDRISTLEDRLFATVFLGSGIFLAMTFVSAALAGGLLASYDTNPELTVSSGIFLFCRQVMFRITNVYGIRMAGVFMLSLATIWWRTRTMHRVLVPLTYGLAAVLLLAVTYNLWVTLVFPGWVLVISVYVLVLNLQPPEQDGADASVLPVTPDG